MTERALLLVPHPALMLQRAAGMSALERQLWTLSRSGFKKVWVGAQRPAATLRLPPGLEILWSDSSAAAEFACEPPYVAVSGDHFIRVETLRYVAESTYPTPVALEDAAGEAVIQVAPFRDDRTTQARRQPLPAGSTIKLQSPIGAGRAIPWLLALGVKAQDGFMARNFDRYISRAVSRVVLDTAMTPNMMTVTSSLIGLCGAAFFLVPTHAMRLTGALLIWLHSVLDGCDGELARIRFEESPLGADIDFWGDNVVHVALFACIAVGFYRADRDIWPILAAVAASVGTLGSAIMNYRERLERRRNPAAAAAAAATAEAAGFVPALTRLENMLAARDFIYLLVVLAYVDRLYEFMWAAAVGSLLFFFMMLYLGRKNNEQASQPHPPREGETGSPASGNGSGHQHLYSRG